MLGTINKTTATFLIILATVALVPLLGGSRMFITVAPGSLMHMGTATGDGKNLTVFRSGPL